MRFFGLIRANRWGQIGLIYAYEGGIVRFPKRMEAENGALTQIGDSRPTTTCHPGRQQSSRAILRRSGL
jgi:hypothetical protein